MANLRPTIPKPTRWLRGRALLEGEDIVLDQRRAKEYLPFEERELAFDLAAIRKPTDALPFVRKYGLLWHGPDSNSFREPWDKWESAVGRLSGVLQMNLDLQRARRDESGALLDARDRWSDAMSHYFEVLGTRDEDFLYQLTHLTAAMVSMGMKGVEMSLGAAADYEKDGKPVGRVGDFFFLVRPPDLLGYAYYQIALMFTRSVPGKKCPECGRVFAMRDKRQVFCSKQCAQRSRYRRWSEKKGART